MQFSICTVTSVSAIAIKLNKMRTYFILVSLKARILEKSYTNIMRLYRE